MASVGQRIKELRTQLGLSQVEFANKIGVTKQTLYKYENDRITNIPSDKIEASAAVCGVSPAVLMGWDDYKGLPHKDLAPVSKKKLPLYDGIAAGEPRLIPDGIELYVDVTTDLQADYVLKVHGDSMTGARIHDGDLVFIRQQNTVENGEIAAVLIDDSATLKRVYFYPRQKLLVLRSENPNYADMEYPEEELSTVKILGKAVAFQSDII